MNRSRIRTGNRDRCGSIGGFENCIALFLQILPCQTAQIQFVFDHENRLVSNFYCGRFVLLNVNGFTRRADAREIDLEGSSLAAFAIHPDIPSTLLDDSVHGRKAKASSFMAFGGKERLKNM